MEDEKREFYPKLEKDPTILEGKTEGTPHKGKKQQDPPVSENAAAYASLIYNLMSRCNKRGMTMPKNIPSNLKCKLPMITL